MTQLDTLRSLINALETESRLNSVRPARLAGLYAAIVDIISNVNNNVEQIVRTKMQTAIEELRSEIKDAHDEDISEIWEEVNLKPSQDDIEYLTQRTIHLEEHTQRMLLDSSDIYLVGNSEGDELYLTDHAVRKLVAGISPEMDNMVASLNSLDRLVEIIDERTSERIPKISGIKTTSTKPQPMPVDPTAPFFNYADSLFYYNTQSGESVVAMNEYNSFDDDNQPIKALEGLYKYGESLVWLYYRDNGTPYIKFIIDSKDLEDFTEPIFDKIDSMTQQMDLRDIAVSKSEVVQAHTDFKDDYPELAKTGDGNAPNTFRFVPPDMMFSVVGDEAESAIERKLLTLFESSTSCRSITFEAANAMVVVHPVSFARAMVVCAPLYNATKTKMYTPTLTKAVRNGATYIEIAFDEMTLIPSGTGLYGIKNGDWTQICTADQILLGMNRSSVATASASPANAEAPGIMMLSSDMTEADGIGAATSEPDVDSLEPDVDSLEGNVDSIEPDVDSLEGNVDSLENTEPNNTEEYE